MAGSRENVENCIAGVVGDNVGTNRDAAKLLEAMFPKVFFMGCRSHAMDLVIEDIAEIPEIKTLLDKVKNIVKFIRGHQKVKACFIQLCKEMKKGKLPVKFPDTRFAHACLMLASLLGMMMDPTLM